MKMIYLATFAVTHYVVKLSKGYDKLTMHTFQRKKNKQYKKTTNCSATARPAAERISTPISINKTSSQGWSAWEQSSQ